MQITYTPRINKWRLMSFFSEQYIPEHSTIFNKEQLTCTIQIFPRFTMTRWIQGYSTILFVVKIDLFFRFCTSIANWLSIKSLNWKGRLDCSMVLPYSMILVNQIKLIKITPLLVHFVYVKNQKTHYLNANNNHVVLFFLYW
jgi:hypothetical protein